MLDAEARTKEEAIRLLAERMENAGRLREPEQYVAAVFARESAFSTAMGFGVAIPHGKSPAVKRAALAFARLKDEVKWAEGDTARYIFMIAVPPEAAGDEHLKILALLSRQLVHEEFRDSLGQVREARAIVRMIEHLSAGEETVR